MIKLSNSNKGIILAFFAAIISGIAIFYSKISVTKIDPLTLTTTRNFYAGIIFLLLFIFSKKIHELKKLNKKEFILLILIGIIGGALPFYLFFSGLQFTSAITANLIQKSLFIWVSILTFLFLKERFNKVYLISFILIILGNFYFAKLPLKFGKGEIMILTATILWSAENILAGKVLKNVSSELVGLFRMGIGSSLLLATAIFTNKLNFFSTIQQFNNLTVIFIGGTILFFYVFIWYKALKYAQASLVTLILTFAVVVGNVLNGTLGGVKIITNDIYSCLIVGVALLLLLIQNSKLNTQNLNSKVKTF